MNAANQAEPCYGKKCGLVGGCCKKQFWLKRDLRSDPCQLNHFGCKFRKQDSTGESSTAVFSRQLQSCRACVSAQPPTHGAACQLAEREQFTLVLLCNLPVLVPALQSIQ